MDGRGGCCIARYAGGVAYDMTKVDHIMLKFRPIAPKPAAGGGSSLPASDTYVKTGRAKRRYVRDGHSKKRASKNAGNKKRKSASSSSEEKTSSGGSSSGGETPMVTLPLLPETPERKESPSRGSNSPIWLNFSQNSTKKDTPAIHGAEVGKIRLDQAASVMLPRAVGTVVMVEGVTDTWADLDGLGCTDEERVMNLGRDTCPGFVSDGLGRVFWTNRALREMVVGCHEKEEDVTPMVWLVMKERAPLTCPAFTCRVRVQYTSSNGGKERSSMTVPCDVWKMNGGGFAWRLDVKAALCLGR